MILNRLSPFVHCIEESSWKKKERKELFGVWVLSARLREIVHSRVQPVECRFLHQRRVDFLPWMAMPLMAIECDLSLAV